MDKDELTIGVTVSVFENDGEDAVATDVLIAKEAEADDKAPVTGDKDAVVVGKGAPDVFIAKEAEADDDGEKSAVIVDDWAPGVAEPRVTNELQNGREDAAAPDIVIVK